MSKHPRPWRLETTALGTMIVDSSGKPMACIHSEQWALIVAMRAEAYAAGQEAMRERAVDMAKVTWHDCCSIPDLRDLAAEIVNDLIALPLQPEPEDRP